jgi:membrane protease YdiL (CAAX protease family)
MPTHMSASAALMARHLLAFVLVVVAPIWDHYDMKKLKSSTDPGRKVRYYRKIIAASWLLAALAYASMGYPSLFIINAKAEGLAWLSAGSWMRFVVAGVIVAVIALLLLPAVQAIWNEKIRARFTKGAQSFNFILPVTVKERQWWAAICVSAGVCEEVLYRGFLLHYFHASAFHLGIMVALLLSSIVFGVGHLYQGVSGVIQTAVLGFIFGIIFLLTGVLLVPIVLHAVIDLRLLLLLNAGPLQAEPQL